jgi:hypothetical protein
MREHKKSIKIITNGIYGLYGGDHYIVYGEFEKSYNDSIIKNKIDLRKKKIESL